MTFLHLMASIPSVVCLHRSSGSEEVKKKSNRKTAEASFLVMLESTCDGAMRGRLRMRGQPDCAPTGDDHRREATRWDMDKLSVSFLQQCTVYRQQMRKLHNESTKQLSEESRHW